MGTGWTTLSVSGGTNGAMQRLLIVLGMVAIAAGLAWPFALADANEALAAPRASDLDGAAVLVP